MKMSKRKTIDIETLKKQANDVLLNTADDMKSHREGVQQMIEFALHHSGNYNGFGYLDSNDMVESRDGMSVGIREYNEETKRWNFDDTDHTRVRYF